MTLGVRKALYALAVTAVLGSPRAATAGSPLSNDPPPLAVCQATIRIATLKLESETRRALSACLTRGIECVIGPASSRDDCCQQTAERCHDYLGRLGETRQHFEKSVQNRRCGAVSLADVLSPDGLGYGGLADACGALTLPGALADLAGLTDCLARLMVAETSCSIGTRELPRSAEALACADLEDEFRAATGADLLGCNGVGASSTPIATPTAPEETSTPTPTATVIAASATPTPSATTSPTPAATATPTASPTGTATATATGTATVTPVASATPTPTPTPIVTTPTGTATPRPWRRRPQRAPRRQRRRQRARPRQSRQAPRRQHLP